MCWIFSATWTQLGDVLEPLSGAGTMTAMPLSPLFRQTEEAAEETADAAHEVLDTDRTRGLSEGVKGTERVDFTGDEHVTVPFERMPVTETIENGNEQTKSLQEEGIRHSTAARSSCRASSPSGERHRHERHEGDRGAIRHSSTVSPS